MRMHADMPSCTAAKRVEISDDPVKQGKEVPKLRNQSFAGRCRFNTPVMAKKQSNATAGLQLTDAAAES